MYGPILHTRGEWGYDYMYCLLSVYIYINIYNGSYIWTLIIIRIREFEFNCNNIYYILYPT